MSEQKPFHVETSVDAPRDQVWSALTDPTQVREWFGWDYEGIEPEIRSIFVDEVTISDGRLSWGDGSYLEVVADGSRTIVRAVLPGPLDDAEWADVYGEIEEGWRVFLAQLRFLLQTRPSGQRRTLYLTGTTTGERALAAVGAGEPWLTDRYQRIIVGPDGHLVAVLSGNAPLDADGERPVSVIVTTYGLDDAAFDDLRRRWTDRWAAAAADASVTPEPAPAG